MSDEEKCFIPLSSNDHGIDSVVCHVEALNAKKLSSVANGGQKVQNPSPKKSPSKTNKVDGRSEKCVSKSRNLTRKSAKGPQPQASTEALFDEAEPAQPDRCQCHETFLFVIENLHK
jgi:hypothetical protein